MAEAPDIKSIAALVSALMMLMPGTPFLPPAVASQSRTDSTDGDFGKGTMNSLNLTGSGPAASLLLAREGNWSRANASGPEARKGHGMASMYNDDKFVLFGGYSNKYLNDTWVFDFSDGTWTRKSPKNSPSPRSLLGFAGAQYDDKAVLFGGKGSAGNFRETWVYDLSDDNWTRKYPYTEPFGACRITLCAFSTDDKFLFFGGESDMLDDKRTWIYDLSDNNWVDPQPTTRPPENSEYALAAFPDDDKLLMFGGYDRWKETKLSASWVYDLGMSEWYQKNPKTVPNKRRGASAVGFLDDDKVLMSGGVTYGGDNSTWVYDLSDDQWTKRTPPELPKEREYAPLCRLHDAEKAAVFGGDDGSGNELNDTWVFDINAFDNSGNYTSAAHLMGGSSELLNISWNADLPAGTCITVQLRTADTSWNLNSRSFVGPGGSASAYYNASGTRPWNGHTGDSAVQYRVYFSTSNINSTPTLCDLSVTCNRLPERPVAVTPENNTWIADAAPRFSWLFSDADSAGPGGFRWQADNDPGFALPEYDSGEVTSSATSYIPNASMRDGTLYWRVKALDSDGGWGDWSPTRTVKIDSSPPASFVPAVDPQGWTCNTAPQISFWTYDNGSGVFRYESSVDGSAFFQVSSPYLLPPQRDGKHNVTIRAIDRMGFSTDAAVSVFVDATPPREFVPVLDRVGWLNSSRPVLTFETSDDTSGMDRYEVLVGARDFGRQRSPYSLPLQSDGIRIVTVRAYDLAGNCREGSMNVYVDASPPVIQTIGAGPAGWSPDPSPLVQFEAHDNISGLSHCELSVDSGVFARVVSPYPLPPLPDGAHNLTLRVHDFAGNIAERTIFAYIDASPPDHLELQVEDGKQFVSDRAVTLTVSAEDNDSGIAALALRNENEEFGPWLPFCITMKWQLSAGEGTKTVHAKVRDRAGNIAECRCSVFLSTGSVIGRLSVVPASAVIRCNDTIAFKALGFDAQGKPVGALPAKWSAGGLGTIDLDGIFRAGPVPAAGKVTAAFMGKTAEAEITVVPADTPGGLLNIAPVAGTILLSASTTGMNKAVRLAQDGSTDADGDPLEFFIDFGDGSTSGWMAAASADHAYGTPGTFLALLKVRDTHGAVSDWSAPASINITLGANPRNDGGNDGTSALAIGDLLPLLLIPIGAAIAAMMIRGARRRRGPGGKETVALAENAPSGPSSDASPDQTAWPPAPPPSPPTAQPALRDR